MFETSEIGFFQKKFKKGTYTEIPPCLVDAAISYFTINFLKYNRFGPYGLKCVFQSRGGKNFRKTAFLRYFLKFNFDFKKKFWRYDHIIYRGVEEYLGEHFLIYRMLVDLFNMSARGGVKFFWGPEK